jgi:hypothetical protein
MADQGTLEILIDIRSKLEELTRTSEDTRQLTDDLKSLRKEGGEAANMFKTGLGIDLARRSLDLLSGSVRQFVGEAFRMAGQIKDSAQNLGIGTEAYQVLGLAVTDAGGNIELLSQAVATNNRSLAEARLGVGSAASAYRDLGLSVAEIDSLPVERRLEKIGEAIERSTDKTKAFSDAGAILGTRNLPTLLGALKNISAEGYDKLSDAAKKAGMVMSDETINRLDAASKTLEKFKKAAVIATGEAVGDLINSDPNALTDVIKGAGKAAEKFAEFGRGLGYAAAAAVYGRDALEEYGKTQADEAAAAAKRAAKEKQDAAAKAAETAARTAKELKLIDDRRNAELELTRVLLTRQSVETNQTLDPADRQKRLNDLLQDELEARAKLAIAIQNSPLAGDSEQARAAALLKLDAENSAIAVRLNQLSGRTENTPVSRRVYAAQNVNNPLVNEDAMSAGDGITAGAADYITELGSTGERVAQNLRTNLGGAVSDISDGIYSWVSGAQSAGDAALNFVGSVLDRMLMTIIEMGVQWLVQQAIIQTGIFSIKATTSAARAADTAETVASEGAKTPVLAANAGFASIGSYGIASALGIAALVAAIAVIGSLAFREKGGPVEAGRAYVVGEKRPEIFVPTVPGTIIPSLDAFSVPAATPSTSVASAPSLGVSSAQVAGAGATRNGSLTILTTGTASEVRRGLESSENAARVLDISRRGRLDLGIPG